MKYSYPHEVFNVAIESIFKGYGRLQERIQKAGIPNFIEDTHFEAQLPMEIREQFHELCKRAATGEILKMDDDAALWLAKEIFHMYRVVEDNFYREKYGK